MFPMSLGAKVGVPSWFSLFDSPSEKRMLSEGNTDVESENKIDAELNRMKWIQRSRWILALFVGGLISFSLWKVFSPETHRQTASLDQPGQPQALFPFPILHEWGERQPADENEWASRTAAVRLRFLESLYASGPQALRDFHTKAHGCLRGTLLVSRLLPEEFQTDIFQPFRQYPVIARFSNGDQKIADDRERTTRGLAIKMFTTPGPRLLDLGEQVSTFDLLAINHPFFFVRDPMENAMGLEAQEGGLLKTAAYVVQFPHVFFLRNQVLKKVRHPFQTYFSMTPYRWGSQAVKFQLRPCPGAQFQEVDPDHSEDPHFLSRLLSRQMENSELCYELAVQKRVGSLAIENAAAEWKESEAPSQVVATLRFAPQDAGNAERREICEKLSFQPWRVTEMHRPLGGLNRIRRSVYSVLSEWRRRHNGEELREPSAPPF